MSYKIEVTSYFEKQLKRLSKKFPSLKQEFSDLLIALEKNPELGTPISKNCYKIRLSISSKGKGKSGGARVITHIQIIKTKVYLISIYDKSEQSDITDSDLKSLINQL